MPDVVPVYPVCSTESCPGADANDAFGVGVVGGTGVVPKGPPGVEP